MSPRVTQIVDLFARYASAIFVAFLTSFATLFFSMVPAALLGEAGFYVVFFLVGFAGVLSGTFCLERGSRPLGSVILLALGLGYYCQWWIRMNLDRPEYHPKEFPHFSPLTVGGLGAVAFFFLLRLFNKKAIPTSSPPTNNFV